MIYEKKINTPKTKGFDPSAKISKELSSFLKEFSELNVSSAKEMIPIINAPLSLTLIPELTVWIFRKMSLVDRVLFFAFFFFLDFFYKKQNPKSLGKIRKFLTPTAIFVILEYCNPGLVFISEVASKTTKLDISVSFLNNAFRLLSFLPNIQQSKKTFKTFAQYFLNYSVFIPCKFIIIPHYLSILCSGYLSASKLFAGVFIFRVLLKYLKNKQILKTNSKSAIALELVNDLSSHGVCIYLVNGIASITLLEGIKIVQKFNLSLQENPYEIVNQIMPRNYDVYVLRERKRKPGIKIVNNKLEFENFLYKLDKIFSYFKEIINSTGTNENPKKSYCFLFGDIEIIEFNTKKSFGLEAIPYPKLNLLKDNIESLSKTFKKPKEIPFLISLRAEKLLDRILIEPEGTTVNWINKSVSIGFTIKATGEHLTVLITQGQNPVNVIEQAVFCATYDISKYKESSSLALADQPFDFSKKEESSPTLMTSTFVLDENLHKVTLHKASKEQTSKTFEFSNEIPIETQAFSENEPFGFNSKTDFTIPNNEKTNNSDHALPLVLKKHQSLKRDFFDFSISTKNALRNVNDCIPLKGIKVINGVISIEGFRVVGNRFVLKNFSELRKNYKDLSEKTVHFNFLDTTKKEALVYVPVENIKTGISKKSNIDSISQDSVPFGTCLLLENLIALDVVKTTEKTNLEKKINQCEVSLEEYYECINSLEEKSHDCENEEDIFYDCLPSLEKLTEGAKVIRFLFRASDELFNFKLGLNLARGSYAVAIFTIASQLTYANAIRSNAPEFAPSYKYNLPALAPPFAPSYVASAPGPSSPISTCLSPTIVAIITTSAAIATGVGAATAMFGYLFNWNRPRRRENIVRTQANFSSVSLKVSTAKLNATDDRRVQVLSESENTNRKLVLSRRLENTKIGRFFVSKIFVKKQVQQRLDNQQNLELSSSIDLGAVSSSLTSNPPLSVLPSDEQASGSGTGIGTSETEVFLVLDTLNKNKLKLYADYIRNERILADLKQVIFDPKGKGKQEDLDYYNTIEKNQETIRKKLKVTGIEVAKKLDKLVKDFLAELSPTSVREIVQILEKGKRKQFEIGATEPENLHLMTRFVEILEIIQKGDAITNTKQYKNAYAKLEELAKFIDKAGINVEFLGNDSVTGESSNLSSSALIPIRESITREVDILRTPADITKKVQELFKRKDFNTAQFINHCIKYGYRANPVDIVLGNQQKMIPIELKDEPLGRITSNTLFIPIPLGRFSKKELILAPFQEYVNENGGNIKNIMPVEMHHPLGAVEGLGYLYALTIGVSKDINSFFMGKNFSEVLDITIDSTPESLRVILPAKIRAAMRPTFDKGLGKIIKEDRLWPSIEQAIYETLESRELTMADHGYTGDIFSYYMLSRIWTDTKNVAIRFSNTSKALFNAKELKVEISLLKDFIQVIQTFVFLMHHTSEAFQNSTFSEEHKVLLSSFKVGLSQLMLNINCQLTRLGVPDTKKLNIDQITEILNDSLTNITTLPIEKDLVHKLLIDAEINQDLQTQNKYSTGRSLDFISKGQELAYKHLFPSQIKNIRTFLKAQESQLKDVLAPFVEEVNEKNKAAKEALKKIKSLKTLEKKQEDAEALEPVVAEQEVSESEIESE